MPAAGACVRHVLYKYISTNTRTRNARLRAHQEQSAAQGGGAQRGRPGRLESAGSRAPDERRQRAGGWRQLRLRPRCARRRLRRARCRQSALLLLLSLSLSLSHTHTHTLSLSL